MDSKYNYKRLKPSLMAVMFLFLSACQGTSQDIGARIAKSGDSSGKAQGRTVEDAALKEYRIDPTSLDAYKNHLAAKFLQLGSDSNSTWDKYFAVKTWYMGPKSVAEKLPAPMTKTTDDSAAGVADAIIVQQTQDRVYIDLALFEKLSEEKKAHVLLTDFMKGIYSLKNLSSEQLCILMKENLKVEQCAKHKEVAEETSDEASMLSADDSAQEIAQKKKKSLRESTPAANTFTEDDSKIVKRGVQYIDSLESKIITLNVIDDLEEMGFDVRVFDYKLGKSDSVKVPDSKSDGTEKQGLEISREQFKSLLAQMEEATKKGLLCSSVGSEEDFSKCKVSLSTINTKKAGLKIQVNETFSIEDAIYLDLGAETIDVGSFADPVTKLNFVVVPLTGAGLSVDKQVVGSRYRSEFILAISRNDSLEFFGLLSFPGIIKNVKVSEDQKTRKCTGASFFGAQVHDNGIQGVESDNYAIFASVTANRLDASIATRVNPIAPCY